MKPTILSIYPGPIAHYGYKHGNKLHQLSRYYRGSVVTTNWIPGKEKIGNFDVVAVPTPAGERYLTKLRLFFQCMREARRLKNSNGSLDLIVTYDPLKTGLFGLIVKKIYGGKLIVEINGDFAAKENYLTYKTAIARYVVRLIYMSLEKFIIKRSDGVKILYDDQITWMKFNFRGQCVRRIFNYQGLDNFKNLSNTKTIVFVGSPYYLKGVDLLIDAFKDIADKHKDWSLNIIGWFTNLDEVVAKIDCHPQIKYSKPVKAEKISEIIGSCGFLVLPSRTEGMGRVLLEAMACGKPRIGSRVGGIPTVIEHEIDGLLFDKNDREALRSAMEKLITCDDLRSQMGKNAIKRALKEFSLESYISQTVRFYNDVLSQH